MPPPFPDRPPLILLVNRADRAMQGDMVRTAHELGYPQVKQAHNAVFGALGGAGARATDLAVRAGITRQSMGEIVRELVGLGFVTMEPDPLDRRAKLIKYTPAGVELTNGGFQHILDLEGRFAKEFGAERYEQVRDVLEQVVELLEPDLP
jgi:DNA-binding MarR family transcriptional regulator